MECAELQRSGSNEECCLVVTRYCDDPASPTVSADCGINDSVVRAWASGPIGDRAPWATSDREVIIRCGDCGDPQAECPERLG